MFSSRIGLLSSSLFIAGQHARRNYKVCILGACGGIGQPASLLLKMNPLVTELSLYDLRCTKGMGTDLSHISTRARISAWTGDSELHSALKDSTAVLILAGASSVPNKPNWTRDDLFVFNAGIIKHIAEVAADACPKAMFLMVTNPVNSLIPLMGAVFRAKGVYDARKLFGITNLDVSRANVFVAENQHVDVRQEHVTVVGGHSGKTIVPLLSQVPNAHFSQAEIEALTKHIQEAGYEVLRMKGGESSTLSIAQSTVSFADSLLRAKAGLAHEIQCAFVANDLTPAPYFETTVLLGSEGVERVIPFGEVSAFEKKEIDEMLPTLLSEELKGIDFVVKSSSDASTRA